MSKVLHKKQIKINSILLGLFLAADILTKIISNFIYINNNLLIIYLSIFVIGFVSNVVVYKYHINKNYILFLLIANILILLSFFRVDNSVHTLNYLIYFLTFSIFGGFNLQFPFSEKIIFKCINKINILYAIYLYYKIFTAYSIHTLNPDYTMDLSYTSLIGIFSYIIYYFLYNQRKRNIFFFIETISVILSVYFLIFISYNRGALITLLIFLVFLVIKKLSDTKYIALILTLTTILAIYMYNNIEEILMTIYNFARIQFNISLNWISKSLYSISQSMSSGRNILYSDSLELFKEKPVFGHGIGYFASKHNGQYPHNIFLELLVDQGLFISIIMLTIIIYILYIILFKGNKNNNALEFYLFFLAIPRLIISSSFWYSPFFWLLLILVINRTKLISNPIKFKSKI